MKAMTNPNASYVQTGNGGTAFVGPDAVNLFRAMTLRTALAMYASHRMLMNRALSPAAMLTMAKEYTGKTYKRGEHRQASIDLEVWINTMKAAMPVVNDPKLPWPMMDDEDDFSDACPMCGGDDDGNVLGTLGRLTHYRCRACGWMWSHE